MRVLIHDFAGHPFQLQLSNALAQRGHEVLHTYCASLSTTPQSINRANGTPGLRISPIHLSESLNKDSLVRRWQQERVYGKKVASIVESYEPDVVLSANTPLDAQAILLQASRRVHSRFVFWLQDVIGIATERILNRKLPFIGHLIGRYYTALERRLLQESDHVVLITADFESVMRSWCVPPEQYTTIENWAPLEQLPLRPRHNLWSQKRNLDNSFCFLYAGTLGQKHDVELLFRLAKDFRTQSDVEIIIVSEGSGASQLKSLLDNHSIRNTQVLGFQPFSELADMHGSADVLVGLLREDAGIFSVPSKILSYMCAGRPVLLAAPESNLASRLVSRTGAGIVCRSDDVADFLSAAHLMHQNAQAREEMGARGRAYAEEHFDIDRITDRFETILFSQSR